MAKTFLTAEWRNLVMANYAVDPKILEPYVPKFTELDFWNGTCYLSLVGFMFCNTRVLGWKIPFHVNFEEFNLRFYVRHKDQGEWKRGTVFIKEIVPKPAITFVANTLYREHYATLPMRHEWTTENETNKVRYEFKWKGTWNFIEVNTQLEPEILDPKSEAAFITEHYWGYTRFSDKQTSEYQVKHPAWNIYPVVSHEILCQAGSLYGPEFSSLETQEPLSVFMAEGSEISVHSKRIIK